MLSIRQRPQELRPQLVQMPGREQQLQALAQGPERARGPEQVLLPGQQVRAQSRYPEFSCRNS